MDVYYYYIICHISSKSLDFFYWQTHGLKITMIIIYIYSILTSTLNSLIQITYYSHVLLQCTYARESRCRRAFACVYNIWCKYTVSLKCILIIRVRLDSFENENSSEDTCIVQERVCASSVRFKKRQQLYARTDAGWKSAKITCTHTNIFTRTHTCTLYTHLDTRWRNLRRSRDHVLRIIRVYVYLSTRYKYIRNTRKKKKRKNKPRRKL